MVSKLVRTTVPAVERYQKTRRPVAEKWRSTASDPFVCTRDTKKKEPEGRGDGGREIKPGLPAKEKGGIKSCLYMIDVDRKI